MNKAVALMAKWGEFEDNFPAGTIEDFCRYYLSQNNDEPNARVSNSLVPDNADSQLMRLMGRIMLVHGSYADKALLDSGLSSIEEFAMLNSVVQLKHPKKSEAIQACLHEISTGTDILKRLIKAGYLDEKNDLDDKRSKRLTVTAKGEEVAIKARKRVAALAKLILHSLEENDKKLCIQLLKVVEEKLSEDFPSHKAKTFEEMYSGSMTDYSRSH